MDKYTLLFDAEMAEIMVNFEEKFRNYLVKNIDMKVYYKYGMLKKAFKEFIKKERKSAN